MSGTLKTFRRSITLLSLFYVFIPVMSSGQYVVKNPTYTYRENSRVNIQAVRVNPDHLWIDFLYKETINGVSISFNDYTKIIFDNFLNKNFLVDGVNNISSNTYQKTKRGKSYYFSARFPFSIYDLFFDSENKPVKSAVQNFIATFPLKLNIVNCDQQRRKAYNISTGLCWDFRGVKLNLSMDQTQVLLLQSVLQKKLVKDEFETTAGYEARMRPDSIFTMISYYMKDMEWIFESICLNRMKLAQPVIQYNSDQQVFTMQYPGVAPVRFKYPIEKARSFKDSITGKTIWMHELQGTRDSNDIFHLSVIELTDKKGKKYRFNNLDASDREVEYTATLRRIYNELKKVYPRKDIFK